MKNVLVFIGLILLIVYIAIIFIFTVLLLKALIEDKIDERKRRKNENL